MGKLPMGVIVTGWLDTKTFFKRTVPCLYHPSSSWQPVCFREGPMSRIDGATLMARSLKQQAFGRLGQGPLCGAGITIAALRPGSPLRETLLSIYRKFDAMRLPSNDVYARTGSSSKRLESSVTPSQHPSHHEEHKGRQHRRPLVRPKSV